MEENLELKPKSINELLRHNFFIPHYQRGYRWTVQQVNQLLEDIDSFISEPLKNDASKKTFYCLQPVVLKKMDESSKKEHDLKGDWFEVIDGQQRLTTIFLINHYSNEKWEGDEKNPEPTIKYEIRPQSETFLPQLKIENDAITINKVYIDYYYMSSAYKAINDWRIGKGNSFQKNTFKQNFYENSSVIWYEVPFNEDGNKLFERLNMGKIPLTNAELIKALFLTSKSFPDLTVEEKRIKHFEIAKLWDEIEHKLNEPDKKFWSFITNNKIDKYETKIELILDMISNKAPEEKDPYFTFLYFNNKVKGTNGLKDYWELIEKYYYTLLEWFKNKNLYHKIGYLITSNNYLSDKEKITVKELIEESEKSTKSVFDTFLLTKIKNTVNFEISELRYGTTADNHKLQRVLLLYNVVTILMSDSITEFYPFKIHKDNLWSLEHIHARKSQLDKSKQKPWLEWLSSHEVMISEMILSKQSIIDKTNLENILNEIKKYNNPDVLTWDIFIDIFNKVNELFIEDNDIDKDSDSIANLALLSIPDNAAVNNSVFEVKRRVIVKLDQNGSYIPVCTRRVFMKYYSAPSDIQYYWWTNAERKKYLNHIKNTLKKYLP